MMGVSKKILARPFSLASQPLLQSAQQKHCSDINRNDRIGIKNEGFGEICAIFLEKLDNI